VAAHQRGVKVEVMLDKSQHDGRGGMADFLARSGVTVLMDGRHAIAHNKVMVIDEETVITGSFNFTNAAEERNAENLLVIRDKALAQRYAENWRFYAGHSERY
jgi:phosphatidylserine/phosphatidylglycerophosphate/cardiolipin synthase-like enzyme